MPPAPVLDPASIDSNRVLFTRAQIYEVLPQRYEFSQLDGIIHADRENIVYAAYRDVRADEWWCRGHMPQQPIFPGVLMVESAAQLSAFIQYEMFPTAGIMGFAGIEGAKFRDSIFPPARIILVAKAIDTRLRKFQSLVQGFVGGKMAFEGVISGTVLKNFAS
ncbi:MAG TPA: 3-hydroxyacyl-ACP dehydratase FabZ family protein [Phycisphaerae bacterium]|nr:3-hydroxyacyl-ACP dehydratase FabZ family protein [Phycisphaerae bacterium]